MDQSPALPRRVAWFAPWTWSKRARWVLVAALLVGYLLAPAPAIYVLDRFGRDLHPLWTWPLYTILFPIRLACEQSTTVADIYIAEYQWMVDLFGPVFPLQYDSGPPN
jgi:hypothetical protein